MFGNVGSLVLYVLLALAILILPGLALLRLALPGKTLGILCRIAIAPGITVAISVLVFTWCQVFGLKPGPVLPWVLIVAAGFVFVFVRPGGFALPQWLQTSTRRRLLRVGRWRLRRVAIGDAMAGITLVILLIVFFVVRFHATWKWFVPPGADSAQHTIIVQLLIENGGLFESWAPYSDAQTFTYHFGFHAVTVLFAWWLRLDALEAVFIMARVAGATAALSLFTLVRLWSRSAWGGLFAVTFWFFYSGYLQSYDLSGRWALLTGLTAMTSCVVLISIYLRQRTTS